MRLEVEAFGTPYFTFYTEFILHHEWPSSKSADTWSTRPRSIHTLPSLTVIPGLCLRFRNERARGIVNSCKERPRKR